jgi:hypothetical protein
VSEKVKEPLGHHIARSVGGSSSSGGSGSSSSSSSGGGGGGSSSSSSSSMQGRQRVFEAAAGPAGTRRLRDNRSGAAGETLRVCDVEQQLSVSVSKLLNFAATTRAEPKWALRSESNPFPSTVRRFPSSNSLDGMLGEAVADEVAAGENSGGGNREGVEGEEGRGEEGAGAGAPPEPAEQGATPPGAPPSF